MTSIFFQLQALILHEECYKTRRVLQDKNATSSCDVLNVKHCNSIMFLCFQNLSFTNSILVPFLTHNEFDTRIMAHQKRVTFDTPSI